MSTRYEMFLHTVGTPETQLEYWGHGEAASEAHVGGKVLQYLQNIFNRTTIQWIIEEKIAPPEYITAFKLSDTNNGVHKYTVFVRRIPLSEWENEE